MLADVLKLMERLGRDLHPDNLNDAIQEPAGDGGRDRRLIAHPIVPQVEVQVAKETEQSAALVGA